MNTFLKKSETPVVLLDGTEYLIVANGFNPVLKFLHDVREWAVVYKAIFVLPISPAALDERELAIIERHMNVIDFD